MGFLHRTPEGLLGRNDSKNPATTCKGFTTAGRPCRRELASSKPSKGGVLAVTPINDAEGAAAYFCWQHKDQAEQLVQNTPQNGTHLEETHIVPLQKRSSIDTLVGRLGILDVEDSSGTPSKPPKKQSKPGQNGRPSNGKIQRPPTWNKVNGPLISVPEDVMNSGRPPKATSTFRLPVQKREPGFWATLCCMCLGNNDDEFVEIVRHKKRTDGSSGPPQMSQVPQGPRPAQSAPKPSPTASKPLSSKPARPVNATSPANKTQHFLSFIPPTVSPHTASLLMAEASKPISGRDEPGFIYIFWLTETTGNDGPSDRDASLLLAAPSRPEAGRQTSDVLRQYSVKAGSSPRSVNGPTPRSKNNDGKRHVLLKIGRANNVFRRMNEWQRQCGKTPSLVRFYPYVPSVESSPQPVAPKGDGTDAVGVRKVPHVNRVERLIHLELAEQRVMRTCDACGKEHREWFEVEASRDGVKGVDEIVRRWVRWAEELQV